MTINCYSTEKIYYNFGDWIISDLDKYRSDYLFEAVNAEIISKSQMLYINFMDKKNTNQVLWNCAYCGCDIHINIKRKKPHWKEFLCGTCSKLSFRNVLTRSVMDFHKHVQSIIASNLAHDDELDC